MGRKIVDTLLPTTMVGSYPRPHWYTQQLLGRDVRVAFKEVNHEEAYHDATHAVILSVSDAVPGSVELPLEHLSVLWVNRREAPRMKSARTRPLFAPVVLVLRIAFFLARGQDGRPPAWRAMLCILHGIFHNTRTRAKHRRNIRYRRAERQPPCAAVRHRSDADVDRRAGSV